MQLKELKLVGFKSFVDPTILPFDSQVVGVVGPNGCGKSNVIDAVRWVMGESSAKNLRGGSMADVIFNGSSARKPVSQASVELIFDNNEGKVGGEYASYAEISIKREVTRDGQSDYFLNGTKCRRRDVTDVFLGTGLGPRSYSIIEQGMISNVIDAKPENLRAFFEEAAGISVYKKRRHDTELRIRHTRENLERIEDLIQEQERLLEKLKRQSRAAIRYREYKEEKDVVDLEVDAMKWKGFDDKLQAHSEQIREMSTKLEEKLAKRASIDNSLTKIRVLHGEKSHDVNEVQGEYYEIGSDIARLEQNIQNKEERKKQLQDDLDNTEHAFSEIKEQIKEDRNKLNVLNEKQDSLLPDLTNANDLFLESEKILNNAQAKLDEWNEKWDILQKDAQIPQRNADIEKTKIEQLEKQIREIEVNIERLEKEKATLTTEETQELITNLEMEIEIKEVADNENKLKVEQTLSEINMLRDNNKENNNQIDTIKGDIQTLRGRSASLEELQRAALGKDNEKENEWLDKQGLQNAKRLAQILNVEPGYEKAIETVLGDYLEAICVSDLKNIKDNIEGIEDSKLIFLEENAAFNQQNYNENATANSASLNSLDSLDSLESLDNELNIQGILQGDKEASMGGATKLISKINSNISLESLIANVYVVNNLNEALLLKEQLKQIYSKDKSMIAGSNLFSIVTKDGIWLGNNWVRIYNTSEETNRGVLVREKELQKIKETLVEKENVLEELENKNDEVIVTIKDLEVELSEVQKLHSLIAKDLRDLTSKLSMQQTRYDNIIQRSKRILKEIEELQIKLKESTQEVNEARCELEKAIEQMAVFSGQEETLEKEKESLLNNLSSAQSNVKTNKDNLHELQLEQKTVVTQLNATNEGISRLQNNLALQDERIKNIVQMLQEVEPSEEVKHELEVLLEDRVEVEKKLSKVRDELEEIDQQVVSYEEERKELGEKIQDIRNNLDAVKMEWQSFEIRKATIAEKFEKAEINIEDIFKELPEDAEEEVWEERLETLTKKIDRLGPINLAAIDEYKSEKERAEYLQSQFEDLSEAMQTLENAIKKIDKETKSKFKETFDKVNNNFKALFPKLFGGGEAYLDLIGEDLLDAGVGIMAQPPGKRNSSIQLLSGGEKALTAVALVFAIFQLNPAPFCLLDEVDAPLDDSNVDRFCDLIKEMSDKVQFIIITHNKITMEVVKHLTGVTMKEPGVSRLVSVDVDEAVEMTN